MVGRRLWLATVGKADQLGTTIPQVIVIDDFLPDAYGFRNRALNLNYAVEGRYPGLNSIEKVNIRGLDELISRLVYEPVRAEAG